jgi:hypothetical protein
MVNSSDKPPLLMGCCAECICYRLVIFFRVLEEESICGSKRNTSLQEELTRKICDMMHRWVNDCQILKAPCC